MTGSGKTDLLCQLSKLGQQVIDLEGLANHKGSAFGAIGQKPQPSTEFFENLLFEEIAKLDPNIPTWVEDESKSIGSVFIPNEFFSQMLNSPVIAIELPTDIRIERLAKDYTNCNPELLIASFNRINKRLGSDNASRAIKSIQEGRFSEAIEITLKYYDKTYLYGLSTKKIKPIIIQLNENDILKNSKILIEKLKESL
jgi:tRNA 2-selenouridine synthase